MRLIYTTILLLFLITSCKQIDPNKQIDEGKVENESYTSNDIGWTINIPENWKITSKKQSEASQQKGIKLLEDYIEEEIDISTLKNLIGFQKNVYNQFLSTSEAFKIEYDGEWEENNIIVKQLIYDTFLSKDIKADSTATQIVKVDGLDFHTYGFTIYSPKGDVIIKQILYCRLINGFDFAVNINYNNEADKKEMMDAWLNSKFKKSKSKS